MRTTVTDSDEAGRGRIHAVLRESGIGDSPRLLAALTAFTEDAPPVPAPSPELAALITGGAIIPLAPARFRRRILPAALVAAALALGAGAAAAASPDVRHAVDVVMKAVTGPMYPAQDGQEPPAPTDQPVETGHVSPDGGQLPGGAQGTGGLPGHDGRPADPDPLTGPQESADSQGGGGSADSLEHPAPVGPGTATAPEPPTPDLTGPSTTGSDPPTENQ